jgi:hypothetical protein
MDNLHINQLVQQQVPEPMMMLLLGIGMAAAVIGRRCVRPAPR